MQENYKKSGILVAVDGLVTGDIFGASGAVSAALISENFIAFGTAASTVCVVSGMFASELASESNRPRTFLASFFGAAAIVGFNILGAVPDN